ncbi:MAG: hypothetical protein IMY70_01985 [Bacteroidetes bacterium]|nr:hypothetical protein [Bacteroidota bacterium]
MKTIKHIVIISAVLLIVCSAYSQNTGRSGTKSSGNKMINKDQASNRLDKDAVLINPGKSDISRISQIGQDNYVRKLKESGKRYSSIIKQYNSSGNNKALQSGRHGTSGYLFIEQFGNNNQARQNIYERNNAVTRQYGNGNRANIQVQQGRDNDAVIIQSDDNNKAWIQQQNNGHNAIINQYEGDNKAFINQNGSDNMIQIDQSGSSLLKIDQKGSKNIIRGYRSSWAESLNGSVLDIEQYGSYNQIDVSQSNSKAKLQQRGAYNKSLIIQK